MLRDSGYSETASELVGEKSAIGLSAIIPSPPLMATNESGSSDRDSRITGSSCRALRHAVAALNRLDDFVLVKIGAGFFSEVFKVTHSVTGEVMVLKMNSLRSNRHNMLKEVQLMNQLCHKNILGFMGVCVHEGQLHALTEFINGGSLEQLIQATNIELTYRVRLKLAVDIARGMEYLHSRDVFHRDLTSKNVLIRKDEVTEEMTAVVGDFGLAAKIPKSGYRLPTVGSPYWMSPECLKGEWYDERSDVFSYGIILCELIARVEADPDILPRTENFGLDYLAFIELCNDPPPSDFLKLAFSCCNYEPKNRPTFSEVVRLLETTGDAMILESRRLTPTKSSISMAARSEEFLPNATIAAGTAATTSHRKKFHRRSISGDAGTIGFPPHTAPSDKARCHFVMARPNRQQLQRLGETMAKNDPHYKPFPSKANPFETLSHFKGVKKILASTNSTDLFSSCFELPSPNPYRSKPFDMTSSNSCKEDSLPKPPFIGEKLFEAEEQCKRVVSQEQSILIEPVVKPSQIKSKTKLDYSVPINKKKLAKESIAVTQSYLEEVFNASKSKCMGKLLSPCCSFFKSKPRSLPSSPTFSRRNTIASSEPFVRFNSRKNQILSKCSVEEDSLQRIFCDSVRKKAISSLYSNSLFKTPLTNPQSIGVKTSPTLLQHPLRSCASSSNLTILFDTVSTPVRRRGSCESGFFSSVGEDFCLPVELVTASSVTLSSSSAASSLFLDSGATVSCSLDDIATPLRGHPILLPSHKRSSSIYTDSSEDVSSLGGGDLPSWDDPDYQAPQQISKIVEYFERKQVSGAPSSSRWECRELSSPSLLQLQREYYQVRRGGDVKPISRRATNHRLTVCEGAVRSKLQLFDKK